MIAFLVVVLPVIAFLVWLAWLVFFAEPIDVVDGHYPPGHWRNRRRK